MNKITASLQNLLKIFKYGDRISPVRDWFILVSVSALILAGSILFNLWLFAKITAGEAIGTATSTPTPIITPISTVQTLFDNRAEVREKYIREFRPVDPSAVGR